MEDNFKKSKMRTIFLSMTKVFMVKGVGNSGLMIQISHLLPIVSAKQFFVIEQKSSIIVIRLKLCYLVRNLDVENDVFTRIRPDLPPKKAKFQNKNEILFSI